MQTIAFESRVSIHPEFCDDLPQADLKRGEKILNDYCQKTPCNLYEQIAYKPCEDNNEIRDAFAEINEHNQTAPEHPILWMISPIYGGMYCTERCRYYYFGRTGVNQHGAKVVLAGPEDLVRKDTVLTDVEFLPVIHGVQSIQMDAPPKLLVVLDCMVDLSEVDPCHMVDPTERPVDLEEHHLIGLSRKRNYTYDPNMSSYEGIYFDTAGYTLLGTWAVVDDDTDDEDAENENGERPEQCFTIYHVSHRAKSARSAFPID